MTRVALALLAVALAAAVLRWESATTTPANASARHALERLSLRGGSTLPPEAVLAIKPRRPEMSAHNAAATPQLTPVMREFAHARSYRPLYERLKASTSRTGEEDWLLARVLRECAQITENKSPGSDGKRWTLGGAGSRERFIAALSEKDPSRARRIAAFDRMNTDVCAGIADVEVSEKDLRALYEHGSLLGDPKSRVALVQAELNAQMRGPDGKRSWDPEKMPRITESQLETVKQVFASNDPYALLEAIQLLTFPFGNLSLRAGSAELPVDTSALHGATTLVACDLGYPCGRDDSRMLIRICALNGRCDANDYREYLFFYGQTPDASQRMGEYQEAIAAARRGDWSYFTFHPGPSPWIAGYQAR